MYNIDSRMWDLTAVSMSGSFQMGCPSIAKFQEMTKFAKAIKIKQINIIHAEEEKAS